MTTQKAPVCERHNGFMVGLHGDCKRCDAQRAPFVAKLAAMTDDELRKACNQYIWLSAYANNNPRSKYHWQCDLTYDECKKRNKVDEIYSAEHAKLTREAARGE